MDSFLKLKNQTPLTHGKSRLVFEHPDDPDLLVKVIRPDVINDRFENNPTWYKRKRRLGKYISYMREINEYLAVQEYTGGDPAFLHRIVGFARTDHGLGLVTEAIRGEDGSLAPTLAQIIKAGQYDATAQQAVETLFSELLNSNVILSDLNLGNLVYTHSEKRGHYFVLIDGIGNNSLLAFKTFSPYLNRRSKLRRFERFRARIKRAQLKKSSNQT